jgi:HSP20 family molecular chaperone IbpA
VRQESARAEYRNGILVIKLEKARNEAKIPLIVVDE